MVKKEDYEDMSRNMEEIGMVYIVKKKTKEIKGPFEASKENCTKQRLTLIPPREKFDLALQSLKLAAKKTI